MQNSIEVSTLPQETEIYPLLVDFDSKKLRPRGGSAYIDFYSLGKLTALMEENAGSLITCISKAAIQPCGGVFLADFSVIAEEPQAFIDNIKGLHFKELYVENSRHFPLGKALSPLEDETELTFVSFAP